MNKLHILLVEDNEGDVILITELLQNKPVISSISVAKNGRLAIDLLEQKENLTEKVLPDIILLDINLPIVDGHEVLKYIKTHFHLKHLPVIMLSTSSARKDIKVAYENHANCFITKPVDVDEFQHIIDEMTGFWSRIASLPKVITEPSA
ncbi:MAG TPA: response regulator [Cyclobacteriaceae bacterium]|nr:response regulator [Cyclobacteriaceae bacterium]